MVSFSTTIKTLLNFTWIFLCILIRWYLKCIDIESDEEDQVQDKTQHVNFPPKIHPLRFQKLSTNRVAKAAVTLGFDHGFNSSQWLYLATFFNWEFIKKKEEKKETQFIGAEIIKFSWCMHCVNSLNII